MSRIEKSRGERVAMSKRQIWLISGLMILSAAIGAMVVMNSGSVPFGFAGPDDVKLGAESAPVVATNEVQALNDAFIAVSKGVTPQVVSITVVSSVKPSSRGERDLRFDDPFEMFEFPNRSIPQRGAGSGVIVTPDGYILTNNHVVAGASEEGIQVEMVDGSQYVAKLIGTDPSTDLAVIKVDGSDLPTAAIGSSDDVEVGQISFAVGNPLGLNSTVTMGIVSAIGRGQLNLNRDAGGYGIEDFIQTDAAINPGNSGGGLFNLEGELIGINSAIATSTGYNQGYGFAIPIDLAVAVAKDLIEDGKVNRGFIGVMIKTVDQKMARYHNLETGQGVLVDNVQPNGAAEQGGLKQGDIILEVDGVGVGSANQLQSLIARKRVGDDIVLKVFRYGETFEKTLTLKARTEDEGLADARRFDADLGSDRSESTVDMSALGLDLGDLSRSDRRTLDIDAGVAVRGVEVYGEAFEQGIREGDVLLSVNRQPVESADEVEELVENADDGDVLLLEVLRSNGMKSLVVLEVSK